MNHARLYCYYRIDPACEAELRAAVAELFDAVERAYGIRGRWMRRKSDRWTCMEIYEDVADPDALAAFLHRECERTEFRRLLADASARHDECFVDAD